MLPQPFCPLGDARCVSPWVPGDGRDAGGAGLEKTICISPTAAMRGICACAAVGISRVDTCRLGGPIIVNARSFWWRGCSAGRCPRASVSTTLLSMPSGGPLEGTHVRRQKEQPAVTTRTPNNMPLYRGVPHLCAHCFSRRAKGLSPKCTCVVCSPEGLQAQTQGTQ